MQNIRCTLARRWRPLLLLFAAALLLLTLALMLSPPAAASEARASYSTVPLTQSGQSRLPGQVFLIDGVTYVPFRAFCELQGGHSVTWDPAARIASVKTSGGVSIHAAADGALYLQYGERYFYTVTPVRIVNDRVYIPIRPIAKCFGLDVSWNSTTRSVTLQRSGGSPRADAGVYNSDELYWLARIIQAEAGAEPLKGKIAVGNVILNRVRSPQFPSTIYGVIFDRKYGVQFSPTANGAIYNTPEREAVIAARICLEGYSLSDEILYFYNPAIASSHWIAAYRPYAFRIGRHVFYK